MELIKGMTILPNASFFRTTVSGDNKQFPHHLLQNKSVLHTGL